MDINFWSIAIPLLGGGAAGALINNAFVAIRNKVPVIKLEEALTPVFTSNVQNAFVNSKVSFSKDDRAYEYSNLLQYELKIRNTSKVDFDVFKFGLTLNDNNSFIYIESDNMDRHHKAIIVQNISPDKPNDLADIELNPFNRGNEYSIRSYINANNIEKLKCTISSEYSVRFREYEESTKGIITIVSESMVETLTSFSRIMIGK